MMIDYFTNGLKGAYTAYTEQIHGIQDRANTWYSGQSTEMCVFQRILGQIT